MLVLEWNERAFTGKVNSRYFCWFPAAILVHQNGTPIWRLHTKLYKGAWNVSANNSETVGHKDLRLGQMVYMLVFYKISFSWLLPLDGFQFIFLLSDSKKRSIRICMENQWLAGKSCFSHTTPSIFGGRCNRYFWDIRLFTGYLIWTCSFSWC